MKNVSDKPCRENQNAHFIFSTFFFFLQKSCHLWDNVEKCSTAGQSTDDNIIWRMRIACWITKATETHTGFVILIAFLLKQWLHERVSVLWYMYLVCFVELFHWLCDNTMTYVVILIQCGAKRTHVFKIIVSLFIFNIKKVMLTPKQPVINAG
jgi:hypothetical protein